MKWSWENSVHLNSIFQISFQTASHHITIDIYTSASRTVLYEHKLFISTKLKVGSISILKGLMKTKWSKPFMEVSKEPLKRNKNWSYLSLLKLAFLNAIHVFSNWKSNDSRKFPLQITTAFFLLELPYQVKLQKC